MKFSKSLIIDIFIIFTGVAGALFFSYLFVQDINATLTRLEEQPVGTITFRYNIAQRRFNNRLVWDRLRNDSPIYNGDVIRTDNLSEVTISFDHGEAISLYSNTLLQVFIDSGGNRIDFSGGDIIINTFEPVNNQPAEDTGRRRRRIIEFFGRGSSERNDSDEVGRSFVINTGDQRVRVERGSAVRLASVNEGEIELTVNEGSVVLEETPADDQSLNQRRRRNQDNSDNSIFTERSGIERNRSERTRSEGTNSEGTNTERNRNTEQTDGTERIRRSIVINTGDQRIRTERGSSIRIDSQDGELEVSIHEGTAVLESIVTDETLSVETGRRVRINLRRTSDETIELSELVIETIEPEELGRTERTRRTSATNTQDSASMERTAARQDTARDNNVRATNSENERTERNRTENNTDDREPRVRQRELLPAPRNRVPADQYTITPQMIMDSQTRSIDFSWDSVNGANGYILTVFRDNEGFRSTVIQTPVLTETKYTDTLRQLTRGTLYWQVEAVRVSENGDIEQRGRLSENVLVIDIPRRER